MMMTTDYAQPPASGLRGLVSRSVAWLDAGGRKAWIFAMILGFVFFWPIGLAIVFYMTATNRWSKTDMFNRSSFGCSSRRAAHWANRHAAMSAARPSGNSAFDAYKSETLRRLQDEQEAFEAFMQRLRDAKDKTEFDAFMEDRARAASAPKVVDGDIAPQA